MALIPVEDNPGLFRYEQSGAIINKNRSDFDIYVSSRKKMRTKAERIDTLETKVDNSIGSPRTEYHCKKCGGHHGHIFDDGPEPTGKRFCNNGACLIFKEK